MAEKKFSDLTAKGAALADTDLLAISESAGGGSYTSKSVTGANVKALITDANLTTTDVTTNDVSTTKHGFAPKAPNDGTQFLDGTGAYDTVKDSDLSLSDITTNNVSTTKHGFVPKAPNNTTTFLRGDGTWATPAAGGLTKFTEAEATTSPNATVYVDSLTAAGSTTNADIAIVPKGSGAFMLDIPDNTTSGGNKRGTNAIDLQHGTRAHQDKVASGNYSVAIGSNNRAYNTYAVAIGADCYSGGYQSVAFQGGFSTGTQAFALGSNATASGYASIAFGGSVYGGVTASGDSSFAQGNSSASGLFSIATGEQNTASAQDSCAVGGRNNLANAYLSYAFGGYCSVNGVEGRQSRGRALGTIQGETQKSEFYLSKRTTDATATTLTVAGGTANTTNQVILSNQSAYRFKGTIIGKQSGSTNVASWDIDGLIVRGANAAATTLVVGNVNLVSNTPAWGTPTLAADTTNGGLRVQAIGLAATNIQWTAIIETTEVIYA